MTECTAIVDDGNPCGESPVWDVTTGRLYWTDTAGRFFSYDWRTRERVIVLRDFVVNGAALNEGGGFTFINGNGVWHWDGAGMPVPIVSACEGDVLQLNDCAADRMLGPALERRSDRQDAGGARAVDGHDVRHVQTGHRQRPGLVEGDAAHRGQRLEACASLD